MTNRFERLVPVHIAVDTQHQTVTDRSYRCDRAPDGQAIASTGLECAERSDLVTAFVELLDFEPQVARRSRSNFLEPS
jgi:hypothetical protein